MKMKHCMNEQSVMCYTGVQVHLFECLKTVNDVMISVIFWLGSCVSFVELSIIFTCTLKYQF